MFSPDTLLAYPYLYTFFDNLVVDLIEELSINKISDFMRKFTSYLKSIAKGGPINIQLRELIWLKNIGRS